MNSGNMFPTTNNAATDGSQTQNPVSAEAPEQAPLDIGADNAQLQAWFGDIDFTLQPFDNGDISNNSKPPAQSTGVDTQWNASETGGIASDTGGMASDTGGMASDTGGMASDTGGMTSTQFASAATQWNTPNTSPSSMAPNWDPTPIEPSAAMSHFLPQLGANFLSPEQITQIAQEYNTFMEQYREQDSENHGRSPPAKRQRIHQNSDTQPEVTQQAPTPNQAPTYAGPVPPGSTSSNVGYGPPEHPTGHRHDSEAGDRSHAPDTRASPAQPQPPPQPPTFAVPPVSSSFADDYGEAERLRLEAIDQYSSNPGLIEPPPEELQIVERLIRDIVGGHRILPPPAQLEESPRPLTLDTTIRLDFMTTILQEAIELLTLRLNSRLRRAHMSGSLTHYARLIVELLKNDAFAHVHYGTPTTDPTRLPIDEVLRRVRSWNDAKNKAESVNSHLEQTNVPGFGQSIRRSSAHFYHPGNIFSQPRSTFVRHDTQNTQSFSLHYVSDLIMAMSTRILAHLPHRLSRRLIIPTATARRAPESIVMGPSITSLSAAVLRLALFLRLPGSGSICLLPLSTTSRQIRAARLVESEYLFRSAVVDYLYTTTDDYYSLNQFLHELREISRRQTDRLVNFETDPFARQVYNPNLHHGLARPYHHPIESEDAALLPVETQLESANKGKKRSAKGKGKGKGKGKARGKATVDTSECDEITSASGEDSSNMMDVQEQRDLEQALNASRRTRELELRRLAVGNAAVPSTSGHHHHSIPSSTAATSSTSISHHPPTSSLPAQRPVNHSPQYSSNYHQRAARPIPTTRRPFTPQARPRSVQQPTHMPPPAQPQTRAPSHVQGNAPRTPSSFQPSQPTGVQSPQNSGSYTSLRWSNSTSAFQTGGSSGTSIHAPVLSPSFPQGPDASSLHLLRAGHNALVHPLSLPSNQGASSSHVGHHFHPGPQGSGASSSHLSHARHNASALPPSLPPNQGASSSHVGHHFHPPQGSGASSSHLSHAGHNASVHPPSLPPNQGASSSQVGYHFHSGPQGSGASSSHLSHAGHNASVLPPSLPPNQGASSSQVGYHFHSGPQGSGASSSHLSHAGHNASVLPPSLPPNQGALSPQVGYHFHSGPQGSGASSSHLSHAGHNAPVLPPTLPPNQSTSSSSHVGYQFHSDRPLYDAFSGQWYYPETHGPDSRFN